MNEKIRNIVFDLGGVLVGLDGRRSMAAFDALGCEAVSEYIRDHRTEDLFYRIELGLITTHEFCEEIRQMTRTTATDEQMVEAWNVLISEPTAERLRALWALREEGYRLFLLSNTNDMHWQHCLPMFRRQSAEDAGRAGVDADALPFERVFLSYEMHLAKPDTQIFSEVMRQAGLQASETLFIDDNEANVKAAASVGMATYWNRRIDDWLHSKALRARFKGDCVAFKVQRRFAPFKESSRFKGDVVACDGTL